MDFTVCVGTFGDAEWDRLAKQRAIPSAKSQAPVIHAHADTLAQARNAALEQVETEFVIHLDADDELELGYVEAMSKGTADLRAPRIRQVRDGKVGSPFMPRVWAHHHDCTAECLRQGNWLIIGTAVRTELAQGVRWEEWGWSEDWAFFARCHEAGGTVEAIPQAIYRAHVRDDSRNHGLSRRSALHWHREIEQAIWPA